jgi:hypothetical protein
MAKYLGLWYGGSNYAAPNGHDPRDCEHFDSIASAARTLQDRIDNYDRRTPCVDDDTSEMHLYKGDEYHEDGPDVVLTIGPRGGIKRG